MLGMGLLRRLLVDRSSNEDYKFFEDPPAHIQNDLQPSFVIMRNLLEMVWDVPFLTLQSVHTSKALFHVLVSHAILNPQRDHDSMDRGLELQRYVDKLDDLFDEMNTIPYGMHPPLARWQCQLDELFEGLCTTNEGSEEVRRSKILLKNLEDADWRKLDICTSEGMARRDQISEGDSSNGSMPYILYASKDNVDNMVTPNGSELSASLGFMNPFLDTSSADTLITSWQSSYGSGSEEEPYQNLTLNPFPDGVDTGIPRTSEHVVNTWSVSYSLGQLSSQEPYASEHSEATPSRFSMNNRYQLLRAAFSPGSWNEDAHRKHCLDQVCKGQFLVNNNMEPELDSDAAFQILGSRAYPLPSGTVQGSIYNIFIDAPRLMCLICGDTETSASRVLGCVRSHLNHRPWVCQVECIECDKCGTNNCSQRFFTAELLNSHIKGRLKDHQCPYQQSDRSFSRVPTAWSAA